MTEAIVHRGPDETGEYVSSRVALGSRRLKVIDLATGRMPIANEAGNIQVVYNGEIYNYKSLRSELARKGHAFRTSSDTEVLVHLYEEHGIGLVDRLVGMFAFAIWDDAQGRLYLVRDRLGIKPLFYRLHGDDLYFGSELKCLLRVSERDPELDPTALREYLALGYIRAPRSIYRGYCKLEPGTILQFGGGSLRRQRYWDYPTTCDPALGAESETLEAMDERLRQAVTDRLVADVPLGAFLSGGVDSSLVVAIAADSGATGIKTFSVGFDGDDELEYARLVAERFDTDHHELTMLPSSCMISASLLDYFDEPFGDSSSVPTYFVSELARRHVTVALSGDGGDELFGGYDQYAHDAHWSWIERIPLPLRQLAFRAPTRVLPPGMYGWNLLRALASDREGRYASYVTHELDPAQGGLLHPRLFDLSNGNRVALFEEALTAAADLPLPARLLYADATSYLPDDVLTKVDRMSMAHSLEARVPLLDHRFVELAARIPVELKIRNGRRKWILKRLAQRYLPPEVLKRPKHGFQIPVGDWLRSQLAPQLDLLLTPDAPSAQYLHRPSLERLIGEHRRKRRDHSHVLWRLLMLDLWLRRVAGGLVTIGRTGEAI